MEDLNRVVIDVYVREDEYKERVHRLLKTLFPGSYLTVKINNILPDTSITDRGRKNKKKWRIAKDVRPQVRLVVETFQPLKSPGVDGIFLALLQ